MLRNVAFRFFLALLPLSFLFPHRLLLALYIIFVFAFLRLKARKLAIPFLTVSFMLIFSLVSKNAYFSSLKEREGAVVSGRGLVLSEKGFPYSKLLRIYFPVLKINSGEAIAYSKIFEVRASLSEKSEGCWVSVKGILKREKTYLNRFSSNLNFLKYSNSLYFISVKSSDFFKRFERFSLFSLKEKMLASIDSPEKRDFLAGLIFGDKNALDFKFKEKAKKMGIYHLFVFSGFHFGIFFIVLYVLLFALPLRRKYKNFVYLFFLFCLLILTGFPSPAVRVFLMFAVYFIFAFFGIDVSPEDSVGLAGIVMLVLNPYSAFSAGFLLSFLITGGIVVYAKEWRAVKSYVAVAFLAFFFALPFYVGVFNYLPLTAPLTTLIVTPLTVIVFFLFFANFFLGGALNFALSFAVDLILIAVNRLPIVAPECYPAYFVIVFSFALVFLSFFANGKGKFLIFPAAIVLLLILLFPAKRYEGVCFFDSKNPYCILYSVGGKAVLINTGDSFFSHSILRKELKMRGIDKINFLILEKLNLRILNRLENVLAKNRTEIVIIPSDTPYYLKFLIESLAKMYAVKKVEYVPKGESASMGFFKVEYPEKGVKVVFDGFAVVFGNKGFSRKSPFAAVEKTKRGECVILGEKDLTKTIHVGESGGFCLKKKRGDAPSFN